ncbi:PASTA domain-containing protein [Porcipelethomonas sp.]|uniref:PASTA domain-containing protein n=1 Tax=Porcipelethomonas sp. TaxID=2981675 RepID=UPI003EFA6EEA
MRKTELYRSIDNIKPDSSMKNRIMNAVETNDRITVHKRPFFVPAAVTVLLIFNLGLIGSFMFGEEFQSRLSGNNLHGVESETDSGFESYADKVYEEITEYNYVPVSFKRDENYAPGTDLPWYSVYSTETLEEGTDEENADGECVYIRYIQMLGDNYTNHEYIIGYDGKGNGRNNMVSITESDVNYNHNFNYRFGNSENYTGQENVSEDDVYAKACERAENFSNENKYESFYVDKNSDICIYAFSYNNAEDSFHDRLFYRYCVSVGSWDYEETDNFMMSISAEGYVLSFWEGRDCEKYWKETVSNDGKDYSVEVLPELENTDRDNAVKQLKDLGFTNISTVYSSEPGKSGGVQDTVSGYGNGMKAGEFIKTSENIELIIYSDFRQMPALKGFTPEDAKAILEYHGIDYKIVTRYASEYVKDGVIYDNPAVVDTYPAENEVIDNNDEVTVYVSSDFNSLPEEVLWTEMELYYSYSEDGNDYYISEDYPGVIFSGYYSDNQKVYVTGVYTESSDYDMCFAVQAGMTFNDLKNKLSTDAEYENASNIHVIDYTVGNRNYNYGFTYTGEDSCEYQVWLGIDEDENGTDRIMRIFVTKQ